MIKLLIAQQVDNPLALEGPCRKVFLNILSQNHEKKLFSCYNFSSESFYVCNSPVTYCMFIIKRGQQKWQKQMHY